MSQEVASFEIGLMVGWGEIIDVEDCYLEFGSNQWCYKSYYTILVVTGIAQRGLFFCWGEYLEWLSRDFILADDDFVGRSIRKTINDGKPEDEFSKEEKAIDYSCR